MHLLLVLCTLHLIMSGTVSAEDPSDGSCASACDRLVIYNEGGVPIEAMEYCISISSITIIIIARKNTHCVKY